MQTAHEKTIILSFVFCPGAKFSDQNPQFNIFAFETILALALVFPSVLNAQISITSGTLTYTQNFNSYTGSQRLPCQQAGQLPALIFVALVADQAIQAVPGRLAHPAQKFVLVSRVRHVGLLYICCLLCKQYRISYYCAQY